MCRPRFAEAWLLAARGLKIEKRELTNSDCTAATCERWKAVRRVTSCDWGQSAQMRDGAAPEPGMAAGAPGAAGAAGFLLTGSAGGCCPLPRLPAFGLNTLDRPIGLFGLPKGAA